MNPESCGFHLNLKIYGRHLDGQPWENVPNMVSMKGVKFLALPLYVSSCKDEENG